jgi:hypothetical protein
LCGDFGTEVSNRDLAQLLERHGQSLKNLYLEWVLFSSTYGEAGGVTTEDEDDDEDDHEEFGYDSVICFIKHLHDKTNLDNMTLGLGFHVCNNGATRHPKQPEHIYCHVMHTGSVKRLGKKTLVEAVEDYDCHRGFPFPRIEPHLEEILGGRFCTSTPAVPADDVALFKVEEDGRETRIVAETEDTWFIEASNGRKAICVVEVLRWDPGSRLGFDRIKDVLGQLHVSYQRISKFTP